MRVSERLAYLLGVESLSTPKSSSTSASGRRGAGGNFPVLARLPDVSEQLPTPRSSRAAAAGFADYRFDPPAGAEDKPAHTRQAARPHVFQRPPQSDYHTRVARQSPILPDSDPFSIPGTSLQERLAPVARFLMLFLLFTAVGTTAMMLSGRRQKAVESNTPRPRSVTPATAASHQRLEPAPTTDEPLSDPLTAIGPLGKEPKPAVAAECPLPKLQNPPTSAELRLAAANGGSLPQVQTSDPPRAVQGSLDPASVVRGSPDPAPPKAQDEAGSPPAVANLPGYILQSPSRQAQHDDERSILH
jgi:hypothetical protein